MINVKKGTAHSLQQSDLRGKTNTGITAGMICYIDASGVVQLGGTNNANSDGTNGMRGFAINSSVDGDVIESGKIALYTLDGNSIIETDQTDTTITAANYPVGTPLYSTTAGKVSTTSTNRGNAVGWVEGIRYLQLDQPGAAAATASTQSYTSATEQAGYNAANAAGYTNLPVYTASTGTASFKPQTNIAVLAIKLAASV